MGQKKTIRIGKNGKRSIDKVQLNDGQLTNDKGLQKENSKKEWHGTKNLIPYKPGQCGNPKGRPVGSTSIASTLKRLMKYRPYKMTYLALKKKYPQIDKYEDIDLFTSIMLRAVDQADNGDMAARAFIAERTEGKVKDVVQVEQQNTAADIDLSVFTPEQLEKIASAMLITPVAPTEETKAENDDENNN